MQITTYQGATIIEALEDASSRDAQLVIASVSERAQASGVYSALRDRYPRATLHIATSCLGSMTQENVILTEGSVSLMVIEDVDGGFGSAARLIEGEGSAATDQVISLLELAQERADRSGESPALIWVSGAPGSEELVMKTLSDALGAHVPIYGGSSADDEIAGRWWVADQEGVVPGGVLVSVIYPSTAEVLHAFHSGYAPTELSGVVTSGEGRVVYEIDGRPAAEVYNEWTRGELKSFMGGGNILGASTMYPLAVTVGEVGGVPFHRLIHPETITPTGGITLFAEASVGTRLILMSGDQETLLSRAGRVAESALSSEGAEVTEIIGGLVTYCAGCMLAVQPELDQVQQSLTSALPQVPFLGQFTFGEQGSFPTGESCHGNLMISAVLFRG